MQNVIDWFISTRSAFERAFGLILNTITSRSVGAFGHTQVLKVSMGLAVFFLIHGALTVILDVNFGYRRSEVVPLLRHAGRSLVFLEVPTLLGVTGFALWWIPAQILTIYEAVVLVSHPLMILAEGFSALTLTFSSGQLWGPCLASQSWSVQILILFGCAAVSGWSFFSMAKMYTAGTVASFISATNTAVALTLLLVLGVATFFVPHASITDATLLILYVTYNIWTACSLESVGVNGGLKISNLASFSLLNLSSASGIGLRSFDFATIIFEAFSIQIVTTLLVQMAIFVAVLRMCRHACTSDYNDHFLNLSKVGSKSSLEPINYGGSHQKQVSQQLAPSTKLVSWIVTIFWPSFGKSLLVLLYTHPLVTCAEETSRWPTLFHLTRAVLWRWVNVYLSLVIYAWSLFVDPEST